MCTRKSSVVWSRVAGFLCPGIVGSGGAAHALARGRIRMRDIEWVGPEPSSCRMRLRLITSWGEGEEIGNALKVGVLKRYIRAISGGRKPFQDVATNVAPAPANLH